MTLIPASKAMEIVSVVDYRTFNMVVKQYGFKKYAIGKRVKYDADEIKRKIQRT